MDLEGRIRRLEDRFAIGDLLVRYAVLLDDRRFAEVGDLFTEDAVFGTPGRSVRGRAAIVANFERAHEPYPVTLHDPHANLVDWLDDDDDDTARGTVLAYAELGGADHTLVTVIRYQDDYRREDAGWRFAARRVLSLYRMPRTDLIAAGLGEPGRLRHPGRPIAEAELPDVEITYPGYLGLGSAR